MAASPTGSPIQVDSSANSGSQNIAIPADCNGIAIFWSAWISGTLTMSSLSIGGSACTIRQNIATDGDGSAVGCASIVSPTTGASVAFAWDWSGTSAMSEGAHFHIVPLKDCNTSDPLSDTDAVHNTAQGPSTESVTLTTNADDYVLGAIISYLANPNGAPTSSDQTVDVDNHSFNNFVSDLFHEITTDSPSTVMNASGEYPALAAMAWKAAPAGGGDPESAHLKPEQLALQPLRGLY